MADSASAHVDSADILNIRLADVTDAEDCLNLQNACLPEKYPLETWMSIISQRCTFLAEVEGKVIGYISGGFLRDVTPETEPYHIVDSKGVKTEYICVVISFGVSKEYRGKGAGTMLMSELRIRFTGMKHILLHCLVGNPAKHLYDRVGFQEVALLQKYYENGDDAHLMVLGPLAPLAPSALPAPQEVPSQEKVVSRETE